MMVRYRTAGAATATSLALMERINRAGQKAEMETWAANAPAVRVALEAMRDQPALADYSEWLSAQLEEMEVAGSVEKPSGVVFRLSSPVAPTRPRGPRIPLYDVWLPRIQKRPYPARAKEFLPVIRAAFAAEGLPEGLVWLAEAESTFNPRARNPAGARGLFQIMPATAASLGLALRPYDQRLHPATSARAAARYLKRLHTRFGDWPLALAAYNGGETRVAKLLKTHGATDFAGISRHLPTETRLYVPKVLATIEVRAGVAPGELAAPRG